MPPIRFVLPVLLVGMLAWTGRGWVAGQPPATPEVAVAETVGQAAPAAPDGEIASDVPIPSAASMTAFARHLEADAALAAQLVALGEAKSRNLFELTGQQRRMSGLLDETDAFLAATELPAEAAPAVAAYRAGAASVRAAMAEAQAGFVRFDWERVRQATADLAEGEAALRRAATLAAE